VPHRRDRLGDAEVDAAVMYIVGASDDDEDRPLLREAIGDDPLALPLYLGERRLPRLPGLPEGLFDLLSFHRYLAGDRLMDHSGDPFGRQAQVNDRRHEPQVATAAPLGERADHRRTAFDIGAEEAESGRKLLFLADVVGMEHERIPGEECHRVAYRDLRRIAEVAGRQSRRLGAHFGGRMGRRKTRFVAKQGEEAAPERVVSVIRERVRQVHDAPFLSGIIFLRLAIEKGVAPPERLVLRQVAAPLIARFTAAHVPP